MGSRLKHPKRGPNSPPTCLRSETWWLLLLIGIFPIVFRQVSVADVWWHVALGKWLVIHQSVPDLSKFYFSPIDSSNLSSELRWEGGGDIILFLCYKLLGAFGLQLFVIFCTAAGLAFLAKLAPESRGPWMLLLLIAVTLGTYQLQLVRTSLFSIILYPLILWMGLRRSETPKTKEYAQVGGVLILWSILHGSCLLGWVTALILFGTRALGALQPIFGNLGNMKNIAAVFLLRLEPPSLLKEETKGKGFKSLILCCVIFALTLGIMAFGRKAAIDFLLQPTRHVISSGQVVQSSLSLPSPIQEREVTSKLHDLKSWLNSSIWKPEPGVPWSNDYWSPFDMMTMRPIQVAFALALLAAISLIWVRPVPIGLMLVWTASLFLGLGYVRMVGYLALASGALLIVGFRNFVNPDKRIIHWGGWAFLVLWLLFSWTTMLKGEMHSLISDSQHISWIGKTPVYDDPVFDWVKTEFPKGATFTTIESGSYGLLRWGFDKPVFLDGFFAPHAKSVWKDYQQCLASGDLAILHDRYGITVAIIPTVSVPWISRFLASPDWQPVALGAGEIVFLHQSVQSPGGSPKIFCTAEQLQETSMPHRGAAIHALASIMQKPFTFSGGFTPQEWSRQPNFKEIQELSFQMAGSH